MQVEQNLPFTINRTYRFIGEDWRTCIMPPQPSAATMSHPPPLGSPFVLKETIETVRQISPPPVRNFMLHLPLFYPSSYNVHHRPQLYCGGRRCVFQPSKMSALQRKYVLLKKMGGNAPDMLFTPVYYGTIFFGVVMVVNTYAPSTRSIRWLPLLIVVIQLKQTF